jgi:threonine/homoserine/homoserine lactone efflux protein
MNPILALAGIFLSSLAIAFSGAVMPGPVFTAVVGESGRRGFIAGPLFMTGHSLLELGLVVVLALGLGPFLLLRPVFAATALAGGAIMLLMGIAMFVSLPRLELDLGDKGRRYGRVILSAVALSLSNPYWLIWWVTIGLGLMQKSLAYGLAGGAAFYLGHIAGDFTWYSLVSFAVSRGKRFLDRRRYRVLIGACAGLLCFFAFGFLWSGAKAVLELAGKSS